MMGGSSRRQSIKSLSLRNNLCGLIGGVLLLLFQLQQVVVQAAANNNELVFLAGPKYCASSSIQQYFLDHVSTYKDGEIHKSYKNWIWPNVYGNEDVTDLLDNYNLPPRSAFDLLITEYGNELVQDYMHGEISNALQQGNSVIVGSPLFSQFPKGPKALKDVAALAPSGTTVKVVLNYRIPRIDQWLSAWKTESHDDYRTFVCADENSLEYEEVLRMLGEDLHPLRMAQRYYGFGYQIIVVDWSGMESRDISQVISCDVLDGVDCTATGVVEGEVNKDVLHLNANDDDPPSYLSTHMQKELEELFVARDCLYSFLGGRPIDFVGHNKLWNNCESSKKEYYQSLAANTTVMINHMREQMKCNEVNPDFSTENEEEESKFDEDFSELKSEEEEKETGGKTKKKKGFFSRLKLPLFFLIAIGAGMYQYNLTNDLRSDILNSDLYRSGSEMLSNTRDMGSEMFSGMSGSNGYSTTGMGPPTFPTEGFRDAPFEGEMVERQTGEDAEEDADESEDADDDDDGEGNDDGMDAEYGEGDII